MLLAESARLAHKRMEHSATSAPSVNEWFQIAMLECPREGGFRSRENASIPFAVLKDWIVRLSVSIADFENGEFYARENFAIIVLIVPWGSSAHAPIIVGDSSFCAPVPHCFFLSQSANIVFMARA
jgi:hypothetical protein